MARRFYAGRRRRSAILLMIFIILTVASIIYIEEKLSPVVGQLAISRVTYLAGKAINDAINDQVESGYICYDDLINLEKDVDGRITALKTNMIKINQFKSEITNFVLEEINSIEESELAIPLGNILNGELFSFFGPKIPVKIVPVGSATASFDSVFSSAGINQTRHQIELEVTVNISVLLPGFSTGTSVTSAVKVAETVIVGNVPNTYTYLEDTGQTGMDIYGTYDLDGE